MVEDEGELSAALLGGPEARAEVSSLGMGIAADAAVDGAVHLLRDAAEWRAVVDAIASSDPGALVLVDQFLNFTSGRADTFYPTDGKLAHVDVTDPYCRTLREQLTASAANLRIPLASGATYACMNGPRFETRAEVEMVRRLGGHLLGQTNYPECVLARELAICYATVGVVSNLAAGMQSSVTATEVRENLKRCAGAIGDLFAAFVREHPEHGDCACRHALDHAEL